MTCHLSRLLLAFRPSDLTGPDRAALDTHLAACPGCAAAASAETAFDAAVGRAMRAVSVPDGLRARLHAAATARQGAAWRRSAAGWSAGVLAAALALTLAGVGVAYLTRPTFTTTELSNSLDRERLTAEESVGDWLASEGLPRTLPEDFEFAYHVAHGVGPVLGAKAPFVLFQNDRHQCRVYVLRRDRVTVPAGGWQGVTGSEFTIQTHTRGEWVYVFAFTTPTLDPFLKPARPVA